jgi:hypothetical protein
MLQEIDNIPEVSVKIADKQIALDTGTSGTVFYTVPNNRKFVGRAYFPQTTTQPNVYLNGKYIYAPIQAHYNGTNYYGGETAEITAIPGAYFTATTTAGVLIGVESDV